METLNTTYQAIGIVAGVFTAIAALVVALIALWRAIRDTKSTVLRDTFAGQAMTGLLAAGVPSQDDTLPLMAYSVADALLAERSKDV